MAHLIDIKQNFKTHFRIVNQVQNSENLDSSFKQRMESDPLGGEIQIWFEKWDTQPLFLWTF